MKTLRMEWLVLGAALLLAVGMGVSVGAADPAEPGKGVAAEEPASPAIAPEKVAESVVLRIKDSSNRTTSANNLKQLAIAVHNYADSNGGALPGDVLDKDGKPLLSWRVRLLPYLEEATLYKELRLDEPWDSKHNLPLVEKMPKMLASPRVVVKRKGYTVYQVFTGPGAVFESGKTLYKISTIPDGTSNTILAVETSTAVPWTKPADLAYNKDKAVPDFGKAYGGKPLAALCDGSVRVLDLKKISAATLKNAINPADGNVLGADWGN